MLLKPRPVLLFVLGLVALDRALGAAFDAMLARTRTGEGAGAVVRVLEHADAEVVVFGSSRAKQHLDPGVLAVGAAGYNAAANGQGLPYARALQALVLAERAARGVTGPQCQVLHVDVVDLVSPRVDRAAALLPFARRSPAVLDIVTRTDPWARIKAWSSAWRYNSVALSVLSNVGKAPPADYVGFEPKTARRQGLADDREFVGSVTAPPAQPDPVAVALLGDGVREARAAGVGVVWVTSPMNRAISLRDDPLRVWAKAELERLADEMGVLYLSMDEDAVPSLRRADLFVDGAHLNAEGAALLSRLVALRLRSCPGAEGRSGPPR